MENKEAFYVLQEAHNKMAAAQAAFRDELLKVVTERILAIGGSCIGISLVALGQRDAKIRPGTLLEYIELDKIWVAEDDSIQISGFIENHGDTDEFIWLNLSDLDLEELYMLLHMLFDEAGESYTVIPLDEALSIQAFTHC